MSLEQLKAFLEKVKGDTSLQEKLKTAADGNAVDEIAKNAGFSIPAEALSVETSDRELEAAAGGLCYGGSSTIEGWIWNGQTSACCRRNSAVWNAEYKEWETCE